MSHAIFTGYGTKHLYEAIIDWEEVSLISMAGSLNNLFLVNNYHQLCMCNLRIVQRTTNFNMYFVFGCCS